MTKPLRMSLPDEVFAEVEKLARIGKLSTAKAAQILLVQGLMALAEMVQEELHEGEHHGR